MKETFSFGKPKGREYKEYLGISESSEPRRKEGVGQHIRGEKILPKDSLGRILGKSLMA